MTEVTQSQRHLAVSPIEPKRAGATAHQQAQGQRFAIEAARLIAGSHCEDVLVLDLRGLSDVADYLVIATGSSDRQIRSVADDVEELAQQQHDLSRLGRDADEQTTWVVLDFVSVVVHLFEPAARAHYDLEMLWGDAGRVDWQIQ